MKVKRISISGFIVVLESPITEALELCTEEGTTLTESSQLRTSHLLMGTSASVFSSRPAARSAITRTIKRAVKEGTFFRNQRFKVVRLIGVPA